MERPPKIYFCNKCGYVGISDTHPGCQYLAYPMANLEQLYIDHLEAELAALRASPASAPEDWKSLTDVQWMNIVNLNHAWANVDKEDAINEVVKLVEAKCKANNLATQSAVACLQSMCEESLAPDVYEMWLQVNAALITTRKTLAAAPTPPVSEDRKDAENSALKLAKTKLSWITKRANYLDVLDIAREANEAIAAIDALGE